jgi:hypothetical protein
MGAGGAEAGADADADAEGDEDTVDEDMVDEDMWKEERSGQRVTRSGWECKEDAEVSSNGRRLHDLARIRSYMDDG